MLRCSFFLLALLTASFCFGQETSDELRPWHVAISPHYGFVIPHSAQMTHLIQGHSYGVFAQAQRQASGKAYWHHAYNMPEQGVDFSFINTGNPQQLGQQFTGSFLLNLPLNRKHFFDGALMPTKKFQHWLGLGLGMGYATKVWDLESNHQAAVLGSPLNIALTLQYSCRVIQWENAELRAGFRMSHLSNGAFQLPNLGTNNAGIFLSYVHGKPSKKTAFELPRPDYRKNHLSAAVLAGLKEIPPPTGRKYLTSVFSVLAERRVSWKSSFGLGMDVLFNSSLKTLMERTRDYTVQYADVVQLGAVFSYTLHLNDFELKMQQGFYVRDKWKIDGTLYHRFGLRYFINQHFFTQLTLKTHFAKADYGEFGLGYRF